MNRTNPIHQPEPWKQVFGPTPDCPPVEVIAGFDELAAGSQARAALLSHLDQCLYCEQELSLAREFSAAQIDPRHRADVDWVQARLKPHVAVASESWWHRLVSSRPATGRPAWVTGAVFAGCTLAVMLALVPITRDRLTQRDPAFSGDYSGEATRSLAIQTLPKPGAFAWAPVPGAVAYVINVTALDGTAIFYKKVTTPTLAYPPEVVTYWKAGRAITWTVTAKNGTGATLGSTGQQRLAREPSGDKP